MALIGPHELGTRLIQHQVRGMETAECTSGTSANGDIFFSLREDGLHRAEWYNYSLNGKDLKGIGRSIVVYYPEVFLLGLRTITIRLIQDNPVFRWRFELSTS
jgi:hypothetical protein